MPLVAAAYGALQGTDAFVFFAAGENTWSQQVEKFTIGDPVALGQFPAAALLYRQGLVQTARDAVHVAVDLPSLRALDGLPLSPPQSLDALRAQGVLPRSVWTAPRGASMGRTVDPLSFLVGRVEVDIAEQRAGGGAFRVVDLPRAIDRAAMKVRSDTGELLWDWGRGLVTIDAPAAQGATGLLRSAGEIALAAMTLACDDEYGSVLLVSLDGAPLATSRRMLLQLMSEDLNTGWSAPGQGLRTIAAVGGPPLVVRNLSGHVVFKRPDVRALEVTPLDFNGYPAGPAAPLPTTGQLTLRPSTFYYSIVKRD
jgi:hypothetical protein